MGNQKIPILFQDANWQSCLVHFLQSLRAEHTKYAYRLILTRFFASSPGRAPDAFRKSDVEDFIHSSLVSARSHGKPLAPKPGSVNFRLSSLKSFFDYAATFVVEDGPDGIPHTLLQKPNPATGVKHMRRGPAHRTLSDEELSRLFSVIPLTSKGIRDRTLFYCFLMLGRRRNELLNLRFGDIEPCVFIENGQSRTGYRYSYIGKGKTSRAWSEMPAEVYEAIQWLLIASGRLEDIKPDSYIFIGRNKPAPYKPLTGSSVLRIIHEYAALAGIPADRVSVHLLRHLNAQQRLKNGQSLLEISAALGHSNIGTTHIYLQSLVTQQDTGAPALAAKLGHLLNV